MERPKVRADRSGPHLCQHVAGRLHHGHRTAPQNSSSSNLQADDAAAHEQHPAAAGHHAAQRDGIIQVSQIGDRDGTIFQFRQPSRSGPRREQELVETELPAVLQTDDLSFHVAPDRIGSDMEVNADRGPLGGRADEFGRSVFDQHGFRQLRPFVRQVTLSADNGQGAAELCGAQCLGCPTACLARSDYRDG